jgi:serine protease Do
MKNFGKTSCQFGPFCQNPLASFVAFARIQVFVSFGYFVVLPTFQRFPNQLVKGVRLNYYYQMSFKKHFTWPLIFCAANFAFADTVQLKDSASVTGRILAEKADSVVVDVGYTVLVVPRSSVMTIKRSDTAASGSAAAALLEAAPQFYTAGPTASSAQDVQDLVKQLGQAVVQVRTPSGLGSGFFVNPDGYLITNFHVIEGDTEISVEVYSTDSNGQLSRDTYKKVRIVAINKFHDLALLHIEDKNSPKFKYLTLGSSDVLNVGDAVFAVGSPMGLERTVTEGIVSTKTRELEGELYLQTTTQINPGNSGGPLFNLAGQVVGVTNMKIMFGEGLGFAIPVELVKNFLDHRDAFAYSTDNPNNPYRYLAPPTAAGAGAKSVEVLKR